MSARGFLTDNKTLFYIRLWCNHIRTIKNVDHLVAGETILYCKKCDEDRTFVREEDYQRYQ